MPAFEPSAEHRRLVRAMSGFGIAPERIASRLGIEPSLLREHFSEELEQGSTDALAKVAQSLFQMATQGKNVAAAIFWMKAQGGWQERLSVQAQHRSEVARRYVVVAPGPCMTADEWVQKYAPGDALAGGHV